MGKSNQFQTTATQNTETVYSLGDVLVCTAPSYSYIDTDKQENISVLLGICVWNPRNKAKAQKWSVIPSFDDLLLIWRDFWPNYPLSVYTRGPFINRD